MQAGAATALVRTLDAAAAFVDRVGIALLHPKPDLVLPSLWEAVAGDPALEWAIRDETGKFVDFTPEFALVWRWKDELPARRLACCGRHVGAFVALVAPRLLPSVYALTGRPGAADDFRAEELAPLQREVADAVLEHGPRTKPELRRLLGGADRRRVDAAIERLQRLLVLTNAGVEEQEQGWPAIRLELLARHWQDTLADPLPEPGRARRALVLTVLAGAPEVSAADAAAALGWRLREAAAALDALAADGLADAREEDGIALFARR